MSDRPRIAVIGGGIAGLAAAHRLVDEPVDVELFEASGRVGGRIDEAEVAGIVVPTAGDNFLARRPEMIELAEALGMMGTLEAPEARDARIFRDGALHPIPPSVLGVPADLDALAECGLVSEAGLARAAEDLAMPDDRPDGDESVGDLVRRRLGDEVLEYVVDPLLGGINAGDSDRLSSTAGVPQIGELARRHRSLLEAAAQVRASAPAAGEPVFLTTRGGLVRIVDRLSDVLVSAGVAIRLSSPVFDLLPQGDRWGVDGSTFEAAIVSTPAHAAARLVEPIAPTCAEVMAGIDYSSVAMVVLVLPGDSLPVDGTLSGVLVPRLLGHHVTAVSFASHKWPSLGAGGRSVLRVSVGRRTDTRWMELSDAELVSVVQADLAAIVGTTVEPLGAHVVRWADALPQYDVGHGERIELALRDLATAAPGVGLAGAALHGLGLPACVGSGRRVAEQALEHVAGLK